MSVNDKNIVPLVRVPCSSSSLSSNFSYPNFLNCTDLLSLLPFSFLTYARVSIQSKWENGNKCDFWKETVYSGNTGQLMIFNVSVGKERGVNRRKEIAVEEGRRRRRRKKNEERP